MPLLIFAQEPLEVKDRLFGGGTATIERFQIGGSYFFKTTRYQSDIRDASLFNPKYQQNFDVSLDIKIPVSSKFAIKTGIIYVNDVISYKDYSILFPSDSDGKGGFDMMSSYIYHFTETKYLGIPFNVHLYLSHDHPFYVKAGVDFLMVVQFYGDDQIKIGGDPNSGRPQIIEEPESDFQSNFNAGMGYEHAFKWMTVFLEVNTKVGTQITEEGPIGSHRKYFTGATLGVLF